MNSDFLAKQWSITLMTALSIVGIVSVTIGIAFDADVMQLGVVVSMTGVGVQLIRSHYANEDQAKKLIDTANALAEKTIATAQDLADKTLEKAAKLAEKKVEDIEAAAFEAEKTRNAIIAVAKKQEEIKTVIGEVKDQVNGGKAVELVKAVAEAIRPPHDLPVASQSGVNVPKVLEGIASEVVVALAKASEENKKDLIQIPITLRPTTPQKS